MLISDLYGKKIAVWGLGLEGVDVVKYLQKHNIAKSIILLNDKATEKPEEFDDLSLFYGEDIGKVLGDVEVVIRSPGVSIYKAEIIEAKQKGVIFTSVCDLFINEIRTNKPNCKLIGVSGSKGKSISVSALAYVLQKLGYKTALGGNIGKPLIELLDDDYQYVVGEFSSYQASDLSASPHIAMFTNLFFVHTDWHNGHQNYCKDKIHLIANQKQGDVYFVNRKNQQLVDFTDAYPDYRKFYNDQESFFAEGNDFYFRGQKLFCLSDLKLYGTHNLDNLAGVFSILATLGIDIARAVEILKDFETLPHRLQKVAEKNGVMFINDSISTAPEAAIGAIKSFDGNLVVISGGFDNDQDYVDYAKIIEEKSNVKMAITLFQTGPKIAASLRREVARQGFELYEMENLEEAVQKAYNFLQNLGGGVALFSPSNPSFGFYKNFIERGNDFINIVNKLPI